MRGAFLALVAAGLAASGVLSSSAFDAAGGSSRPITMHVVGDGAAYLKLRAATGPHSCLVAEDASTGKLAVDLGAVASCASGGAGVGVNAVPAGAYARYAFHDLLVVRNAGQRDVRVWVNATTTDPSVGVLHVAMRATAGQMTDADYAATTATPLLVPSATEVLVGLRVNATLSQGGTLAGHVTLDARR